MDIKKLIELINEGLPSDIDNILNSSVEVNINELQNLKKQFPLFPWPEILTQKDLRQKAHLKFHSPQQKLFTSKGLQQASSLALAEYHYQKSLNAFSIADLCCGIGADLIALAQHKEKVYALDIDEETLLCAQYNCRHLSQIEFLKQPAEDFNQRIDLIFADPDRRPDSRRSLDPETMSPPLSALLQLFFTQKLAPRLLLKLAPALDYKVLEKKYFSPLGIYPTSGFHWEFISENGVLKEILLCLEESDVSAKRQAILLPGNHTLSGSGLEKIAVSGWQEFLFEPDNAIIRAGLVQKIGTDLGYQILDPHIALLTGKIPVSSKFGKTYRILEHFPWNLKHLKKYFKQHAVGELIIKTRGFPLTAEKILSEFKLQGTNRMIIVIVRIGSQHQVAVLEPEKDLTCKESAL
ncbi:MAG: class I SAM-dependent methyltransferase [Candidatus Cloacimonetes bacterium]|nr:class I SAM-dependent methyltransferase [Candidatus Cloacimonadota bacterium]